jgi:hypothetical protein
VGDLNWVPEGCGSRLLVLGVSGAHGTYLSSIRPDPNRDLKALTEVVDRAVKVADLTALIDRIVRSSRHLQAAFRIGTVLTLLTVI